MKKKHKIIVVMPAYNAAKTLQKTYDEIPKRFADKIILVDDASRDQTAVIAKKLGIITYSHSKNKGYGANQKTCYKHALEKNADIIVMIHPDYQHDGKQIKRLVDPILNGKFDIVLGVRISSMKKTLRSGMPLYKYVANRILTKIDNFILSTNLNEYHTGYRAFKSSVLSEIKINNLPDDFLFDLQILIEAVRHKFRIGEVYIPTRYNEDSSSMNLIQSIKFGIQTLITLASYKLHGKVK